MNLVRKSDAPALKDSFGVEHPEAYVATTYYAVNGAEKKLRVSWSVYHDKASYDKGMRPLEGMEGSYVWSKDPQPPVDVEFDDKGEPTVTAPAMASFDQLIDGGYVTLGKELMLNGDAKMWVLAALGVDNKPWGAEWEEYTE